MQLINLTPHDVHLETKDGIIVIPKTVIGGNTFFIRSKIEYNELQPILGVKFFKVSTSSINLFYTDANGDTFEYEDGRLPRLPTKRFDKNTMFIVSKICLKNSKDCRFLGVKLVSVFGVKEINGQKVASGIYSF